MYLVDDALVEFKYSLCRSFKCAVIFLELLLLDKFGHILQLRVKSHHRGVLRFYYVFDKSVH